MEQKINKTLPSDKDLDELEKVLEEIFPRRFTESENFDFNSELNNLCRKENEELSSYHNELERMMDRVGAKDQFENGFLLGILKDKVPDKAMRSFVKALSTPT